MALSVDKKSIKRLVLANQSCSAPANDSVFIVYSHYMVS